MTNRLYYTDPYAREFDARVLRVAENQAGRPAGAAASGSILLTLDRSAFYPTSGGQPFDTGMLGSLHVVDVFEEEDGTLAHAVELRGAAPPVAGETLHGAIDWSRRFEHMQQHTGQHVLSAAFHRAAGAETVSFHLGTETSTIDLAHDVPAAGMAAAEDEANRIVCEDRPVTIAFLSPEEAARLPLRKEPARSGVLRLIDVKDFDLSACGGTHVARTGEIGLIAVTSWERFKGGLRVEFVCGIRALRRFRSMRDTITAAGRLLSVGADELPASIERMQAEAKEQKRRLSGVRAELLVHQAAEFVEAAEPMPAGKLVRRAVDGDAQALKSLALAIAGRPGHVAALISTSRPALAVVARSADVSVNSNELLASLVVRFGGRGGGKPDIAQGGGLDAPASDILDAVGTLLGQRG